MSTIKTDDILFQGQCITYLANDEKAVHYERSDYVIRALNDTIGENGCAADNEADEYDNEADEYVEILFSQAFQQKDALKAMKAFKKKIESMELSSLPHVLAWAPSDGVEGRDWAIETSCKPKAYVNELDLHCENPTAIDFICLSISNPQSKETVLKLLEKARHDIKNDGLLLGRWQTPGIGIAIRSVGNWYEISPW